MVSFTFCGGRLCNTLYYALQMFKLNRIDRCDQHIYICASHDNYLQLKNLELYPYVCEKSDCTQVKVNSYCQVFGVDYDRELVREFIKTHILLSRPAVAAREFHESIDQSRSVAIHIRNRDYFKHGKMFNCFERIPYIKNAVNQCIYNGISDIYVFSDDIELSRNQYDNLLKSRFTNIHYMQCGPAEYDLLKLAHFKHKILFNSTYSVWSGLIGNTVYDGSEKLVTAPTVCWRGRMNRSIYDPAWSFIDVKTIN